MTIAKAGSVAEILAARAPRPLILHLTGDYPDPVREPTTEAIKRLIDRLQGYDHVVISLKRTIDPRRFYFRPCPAESNQRLIAYGHFGLPFGVGLYASFGLVAARVLKYLASEGLQPDLVHSHRLTFDGIAGSLISRQLDIPHFVSVRGEVESKVFRFKPTYRPLLRRIVSEASQVHYVSAWYEPELRRWTGLTPSRARPLPNLVGNVRRAIVPRAAAPRLVTAVNFDIYRKKGLDRLLAAFAKALDRLPGITLDIYGSGRPGSVRTIEAIIARLGLSTRVRLCGQAKNADFIAALPDYLALAMPSRNETFGMVYTEALFAGVPILYSRQTGIDGYLDGLDVGVAVDCESLDEIGDALVQLVGDNAGFRTRIAAAAPELFRRFDPERQIEIYEAEVVAALEDRKAAG